MTEADPIKDSQPQDVSWEMWERGNLSLQEAAFPCKRQPFPVEAAKL